MTESAMRRVLIADDEPLARDRMRELLSRHSGYTIVSECVDGDDALAAITRDKPEIAFLDISMPGKSGVDVAHALLEHDAPPIVVFVTAHDEFALQAFEVSAADFLVKPVDRERFDQMLKRLEKRLRAPGTRRFDDEFRALLEEIRPTSATRRFVVRTPKGHYFVKAEDVESATAEGNYIALAAGGRQHLVRGTMKTFETSVNPAQFVRIHRSVIVAVDRIARVEPLGHGEYRVTMQSGARYDSSRGHGDRLRALLDG
jgi:two-component system LytT family response regulator